MVLNCIDTYPQNHKVVVVSYGFTALDRDVIVFWQTDEETNIPLHTWLFRPPQK